MPKTEPKRHITLSLTAEEIEILDAFTASLGRGTYRNEAVMHAVRKLSSSSPIASRPGQRVVDDSEDFHQ